MPTYRLASRVAVLAVLCVACAHAPGDVPPGPVASPAFGSVCDPVRTVVLEGDARDPIGDVPRVAFAPDGRMAVADRRAGRVRVFDASGDLLAGIGRDGGPAALEEFRDVAFDGAGRLLAASRDGVARFGRDLALDTVYRLPGLPGTRGIQRLYGDRVLVRVDDPAGAQLHVLSGDGEVLAGVHPVDPVYRETPYWASMHTVHAAVGRERIVVADNLHYPLHLYDLGGRPVRELGWPPPSWQEIRRPAAGEFIGASPRTLRRWFASFTQITHLTMLRDRLLVVTHGRMAPTARGQWAVRDRAFDLYTLSGAKVYRDVPVPGDLVGTDGALLYFLASRPPEPWTIRGYRCFD